MGCSDGPRTIEGYQNLPGGNPLVPEVAALPFPSDFYLTDDATTPTGRRIAMPDEAMPQTVPAELFDDDGFTIIPVILTYLPGGTDVASLPSPTDHAETVADDSSVMLVREDTFERVPILAELDATVEEVSRQSIIIRPLIGLEYDTGYVVILRDSLRRLDGTPHAPSEVFRALMDDARTDIDEIDRQRPSFELVRAAIDGTGLSRDEVVQAWSFHTRSEAAVTNPLVQMQRIAHEAPLGAHTITKDEIEGENRQLAGTVEVPNFIDPESLDIVLDDEGTPRQFGVREVPFVITIPETIDEARPVLIYGHGFLGQRIQGTRGSFNRLCQDYRVSAAAMDFGMHERVIGPLSAALGGDWSRVGEAVAEVSQTFVDSTVLAKLIRERLSSELMADPPDGTPHALLDGSDIQYLGISNGGTFGYVMAATSPALSRATLVVGGGGLVHFLQRATQWRAFGALLSLAIVDPIDQQIAFSLLQNLLDPVGPMRASVHMAIHDSQVANLVTEWAMRSARIPVVVPSPKTIYGLETITATEENGAEIAAAMHVYDEDVTPAPVENIPPAEDNGTHGSVRDLTSYQVQVGRFIDEGVIVHVCDGACDPE